MRYGYCRISRPQQSIERQIRNIRGAYPDAVIVQEVYTRAQLDRPEWNRLMNRVQDGDTIIFDKTDAYGNFIEEQGKFNSANPNEIRIDVNAGLNNVNDMGRFANYVISAERIIVNRNTHPFLNEEDG